MVRAELDVPDPVVADWPFLLEAAAALTSSLDVPTILSTLARVGIPVLGDVCFVDILTPDQRVQRAAWAHRDPEMQATLDALYRETDAVTANAVLPHASALSVPLVGARHLGTLTFHGAAFSDSDRAAAAELARHGAIALEHARRYTQAREALALRDQMLAMVSHDLRTPLQIVLMAAAELGESVSPNLIGTVQKIERAAERMDRMIRDLLDYASIDAGQLSICARPQDIYSIIAETLVGFESVARVRNVEIAMMVPDDLPLVLCDRDRILQITGNLVGNAMKILSAGGLVVVRAELRDDKIVISVVDTGPGIPVDDQRRLFERHWRGQQAYPGNGLGLAIARGIAQAHGGEIWVESEVGHGATFSFTLPLAPRG